MSVHPKRSTTYNVEQTASCKPIESTEPERCGGSAGRECAGEQQYCFYCPVSAHIRANNPSDQELDGPSKLLGGVPRVIRRGVTCGPKLVGSEDDHEERGLAGMFLCASIQRQFYKLATWMNENNFSPSFTNVRAQDSLANRYISKASSDFLIPTATGVKKVSLQNFVLTKGTAFFLLPSLTTLQILAVGDVS